MKIENPQNLFQLQLKELLKNLEKVKVENCFTRFEFEDLDNFYHQRATFLVTKVIGNALLSGDDGLNSSLHASTTNVLDASTTNGLDTSFNVLDASINVKSKTSAKKTHIEFLDNDFKKPILVKSDKKGLKKTRFIPIIDLEKLDLAALSPKNGHVILKNIEFEVGQIISGTKPSNNVEHVGKKRKKNRGDFSFNNGILKDALMQVHYQYIQDCVKECHELENAIMLINHVLKKRMLDNSRVGYGFDDLIVGLIACWMLKTKRIKKSYTSLQIFKLFLKFVVESNFDSILYLTPKGEPLVQGFDDNCFGEKFQVCVVGPCGLVNITSHLSKSCIREIQYEFNLIHNMMESEDDRFQDIFLNSVSIELKYDNIVTIPVIKRDLFEQGGNHFVHEQIYNILQQGLGERVKLLSVFSSGLKPVGLKEKVEISNDCCNITIGLILDLEHATKQVQFGPLAQDTLEVEKFKQLWGPKSETRRFQDGSIKEVAVFSTLDSANHKGVIVARMAAFLLQRHFKVGEDCGVCYWAGTGLKFLKQLVGNDVIDFKDINSAYIEGQKALRRLDLPLSINTFHAISDTLTNSSVFVPQRKQIKDYVSGVNYGEFLIEFENSGKWPDDIKAIETMKRAFFLKMVSLLQLDGAATAKVCVNENNESFLELIVDDFVFKVGILQTRVGMLLERLVAGNIVGSKEMSLEYKEKYVWGPQHSAMMNLMVTQYPALGATCRIAKRFFGCHLLLGKHNIPPQMIELLCVLVFTKPGPYTCPGSGFTGFLRLLKLVEGLDFDELLFVETENGKLTGAVLKEMEKSFKTKPSGSIYIATEYDTSGEYFGQTNVPKKLWERSMSLARNCLGYVLKLIDFGGHPDITVIPILITRAFLCRPMQRMMQSFTSTLP